MADFTNTIPASQVTLLNSQERLSGFTHKFTIKYTDIINASSAGATDTMTVTLLAATPPDWIVRKAVANVTTAFSAASSQTLVMEVGTDGDPDNFIAAASVLTAGPIIPAQGGIVKTQAGSAAAAPDVLVAKFTSGTAGNLSGSSITAGEVDIFIELLDLNHIA